MGHFYENITLQKNLINLHVKSSFYYAGCFQLDIEREPVFRKEEHYWSRMFDNSPLVKTGFFYNIMNNLNKQKW